VIAVQANLEVIVDQVQHDGRARAADRARDAEWGTKHSVRHPAQHPRSLRHTADRLVEALSLPS
jgi:hypothetical protein